jgi:hypothetical protein
MSLASPRTVPVTFVDPVPVPALWLPPIPGLLVPWVAIIDVLGVGEPSSGSWPASLAS